MFLQVHQNVSSHFITQSKCIQSIDNKAKFSYTDIVTNKDVQIIGILKEACLMFGFIRLLLALLIFAGAFILFGKSGIKRKRAVTIVLACTAVIIVSLSMLIPFENAFFTFQTPESAFQYVNMKTDVKVTVYGEKSCLVVGEKGKVDQYLIIPKSSDGWKLGRGADTKIIKSEMADSVAVCVYQHKKTGDCYISVFDTEGEPIELHDNYKSVFAYSEETVSPNKEYGTYYAYISYADGEYQLTVNGRTVTI